MNIINNKFNNNLKYLFLNNFIIILKNSSKDKTPKTINKYSKKKLLFTIRNTIKNKANDV